jgi:hypothetical protein
MNENKDLSDRELLEAAAKAVANGARWSGDVGDFALYGEDGFVVAIWNPLEDDGDAMCLAVKLKLNVHQGDYGVRVFDERAVDVSFLHDGDPCETTRRAIVRAAAAIGASK